MKSHCKLLYAHLNKMMTGGESTSTTSIHLYKHHVQTRYNSGKGGLDKCIEICLQVKNTTPLTFETNYVFSMIDIILINTWCAEMDITIIRPWIRSIVHSNKIAPSLEQLRK